ncbi:MAG: hypothetical protein IIB46_03530 [Nitrospinae bacterium]|nr:hypothetical protein [Nitrospinota bacterium]
MPSTKKQIENLTLNQLPFPANWISQKPREVEKLLSEMPVEKQARCIMQCPDNQKQNLLILSEKAMEVVRVLPPEEIYQMIKVIGEEDALPVLSLVNDDQLQFIFDLEWWIGDKFQPKRALEWLDLLDQCDEPKIIEWFITEEFDQKVMLMQALIKVYKKDEMTDSYEGTEELPHYTPDGVYDIFFTTEKFEPVKKLLMLLVASHPSVFYSLMEAVIWYPLTLTVEKAYQWRMSRTSERGIPDIEEAMGVYSHLDPESVKLQVPDPENFLDAEIYQLPPQYLLAHTDSSTFLGQCVTLLQDHNRLDAIHWELVCLANKVMVADREDPANLENREKVFRKVLGYINIGLDLAAEGDPGKGRKLLQRTWMQFLFQAGYRRLMSLKWKAETLLKEQGEFLNLLFTSAEREQMAALVYRFPQINDPTKELLKAKDFGTLDEIRGMENLLLRWAFMVRFAKHCLDLTERSMSQYLEESDIPENKSDMDFISWTTTALARFSLFKEISCQPLLEVAARSFLDLIFLPKIVNEDSNVCNQDIIESFHNQLLQIPMAWRDEDRKLLKDVIHQCVQNLETQFSRIDPKGQIEWKFTQGLCIKLTPPRGEEPANAGGKV